MDMVLLDYRGKGESFVLRLPNKKPMQVLYLGLSGDLNYLYFSLPDKEQHKLTIDFLLEYKGCMSIDVGSAYDKELRSQYKETFPTSHLARFL